MRAGGGDRWGNRLIHLLPVHVRPQQQQSSPLRYSDGTNSHCNSSHMHLKMSSARRGRTRAMKRGDSCHKNSRDGVGARHAHDTRTTRAPCF